MSKTQVFFPLESSAETSPLSSPLPSPQTDKNFYFFTSPSEKAREEAEAAIKKQKEEKLNEHLTTLESAGIINGDYWDDLQESIDIIKSTSVKFDLINRFATLAEKLQNTGMIIKGFYDSIFNLNKDSLNPPLTKIIESLSVISIKTPNAKAYFFELLSNPQNIAKLNLDNCSQIMNILPDIGNNELAEQIDTNLKEYLKKKLYSELLQRENLDDFMISFIKLSTKRENDNLIKFLLSEIIKEENLDLISEYDIDHFYFASLQFSKDSSFTKILEKFKLAQQQNEFKDLDETDLFLSSLEIINGYNEYKDKEIEPEKWERIYAFIKKTPIKLKFLELLLLAGGINFFLQKESSFLDLFKSEIIPIEMQFYIGKLYKTGALNKDQYEKFLKNLKETLTAADNTEALSEMLDATLDLRSFEKPQKFATIDPVIYDLFDKSISYSKVLQPGPEESGFCNKSVLARIAESLQRFIDIDPTVKIILKTAQLEGFIGIVKNSVAPNKLETAGSYKPTIKDIMIAYSDKTFELSIARTIIHELTHKHMYQNVNKKGVPFKEDNLEAQKFFEIVLSILESTNDVLYQFYKSYDKPCHMIESIAYFFEKNSRDLYISKINEIIASSNKPLNSDTEDENDDKTDSVYKSVIYKTAVENYLLPIMHGFDIIFEKLSSIFSGTPKATGTVLDYLDGDYDGSLLEAMKFIKLELDPKITHTITDYLGADWQEADVID